MKRETSSALEGAVSVGEAEKKNRVDVKKYDIW